MNILKEYIEDLKKNQSRIIRALEDFPKISRDEQINQDYAEKVDHLAHWINKSQINTQSHVLSVPNKDSDPSQELNVYLEKILEYPTDKNAIIRQFLSFFPEIEPQDQEVLVENFEGLSLDNLKKEFQNLCELFKK